MRRVQLNLKMRDVYRAPTIRIPRYGGSEVWLVIFASTAGDVPWPIGEAQRPLAIDDLRVG